MRCVFVSRNAGFPDTERQRGIEQGCVVSRENVLLYSGVEWEVCGFRILAHISLEIPAEGNSVIEHDKCPACTYVP